MHPTRTSQRESLRRRRAGRALAVLIGALVVIGIGVAVTWAVGRLNGNNGKGSRSAPGRRNADAAQRSSPDWYPLKRRSFPLTIVASGELEAKDRVEIKSEVEGSTTITWIVDEGETVKKGDKLVKLADDQIKERIIQEELQVQQARASKVAAEQALAIQKSKATSNRKAAELKVDLAKLELEKWRNGDVKKKKRELALAMARAEHNLKRAKEDLALSEQLYAEQFISRQERDDDRLALTEAEDAIETARLDIAIYEQYTHPKEQKKVVSDVEQAEAELDRTLRENASELAKAEADLSSKDQALKIREDRLTKLKDQLTKTDIRAPQDGTVVYATSGRHGRWREKMAQGRQVRFNETLIILPDMNQLVAALKVHEARMAQVKRDQKASITVDARRGAPIDGTVSDISPVAEDGGFFNPDLREYTVKVDLTGNIDPGLKPTMRCSGRIFVGQVKDSLAVPIQAVFTEGRQRFCYVPAPGGGVRRQPVKIGKASESLVVVEKGLSEGQRVLMRKPKPGEVAD